MKIFLFITLIITLMSVKNFTELAHQVCLTSLCSTCSILPSTRKGQTGGRSLPPHHCIQIHPNILTRIQHTAYTNFTVWSMSLQVVLRKAVVKAC